MAITWQNVNAPNNAAILSIMQDQPRLIQNSVNDLSKVVGDVGIKQDEARVQNLLNKLSSFKTIGEVKAFEGSDEYAQMAGSIVRNENQAKVRGANDARVQGLRDLVTGENKFNDAEIDRVQNNKLRDIINPEAEANALALAESGDLTRKVAKNRLLAEAELAPIQQTNTLNTAIETRKAAEDKLKYTPITEQVNRLRLNNDFQGAMDLIKANPDMPNGAALYQDIKTQLQNDAAYSAGLVSAADAAQQKKDERVRASRTDVTTANNELINARASTIGSPEGIAKMNEYANPDFSKAISKLLLDNPKYGQIPNSVIQALANKYDKGTGFFRYGEFYADEGELKTNLGIALDKALKNNDLAIKTQQKDITDKTNNVVATTLKADQDYIKANPELAAKAKELSVKRNEAKIKAALKEEDKVTKEAAKATIKDMWGGLENRNITVDGLTGDTLDKALSRRN